MRRGFVRRFRGACAFKPHLPISREFECSRPVLPDPVQALEARYELTYPWWDPNRGTTLPKSKDFGDSSGQLRLLNKSGAVQTKDHPSSSHSAPTDAPVSPVTRPPAR